MKQQETATQAMSLKLEMLIKPLTAMMTTALATNELSSHDFQWRVRMLVAAGMLKEFIDLCKMYQG